MQSLKNKDKEKGFTLLEVMVAVAIISIALVTLIGSQSRSISIASDIRFETDSSLLGKQKLTELTLSDPDWLMNDEGDFGDGYPSYSWRTEFIELSEDDTSIAGSDGLLKQVEITVTAHGREFTLRSILVTGLDFGEDG
jgi:general secretion pathway protein I